MDLNYTDEESAFQIEVRNFLAEKLPKQMSEKVRLGGDLTKAEMDEWHSILNDKGWLAQNWPKAFGGAEWDAVQRHIYEEEAALANAPRIIPFGLSMLAPVLQKFGSQEQCDHWLPRILSGEDWWCQGYSEPGAGSDLASLKTRAVREGDHYIVNGQKTWTTLGQHANMIFCLVRTDVDVKQQEGISFLLIDMNTPGIEVRPIVLLDGGAEVNEVWFTDVKVPVANLVGEENMGWTYAKYLLTHERTNIAGVGFSNAGLQAVKRIAKSELSAGKPLIENPHFAGRIAQVEIDLMAMSLSNLRIVSQAAKGGAPGLEASMLKVKGSIIRQEINDLARRAVGPYALPFASEAIEGANEAPFGPEYAAPVAAEYFNNRKLSIFGGSNEVQRQIIAKTTLGAMR
ncbi:MAG: acyl-CoA dehydrogenase family protein [Planktotalea sp.]|jgi:alkylation response protein AidB-like acyl-CoA dehydrogenase|uniref:acyl-CoA dehydrogenase family protein n=1 Tax=Planktotalea sp. TaxID=2029877 RepID=UPI000183990F|nr:acyl-CoA dehydrogenase family protein [Planktotalea sp.]EDZ43804.1 acyl-CoA dehydrogenase family protein [Rhodobacteraceae bacterium HTCC2083]MBT5822441.1 pimeloyl-CoA dehydrogenase large subunit [Paracoccaceae bacterium]MDG1078023.1 acyl-CoA dehydrogenase family protein [Planktotalea sp.]MDG1082693.1 acyl-CoA dehydrogenase family protein [Planktotalea sp.]HCW84689.1 pimeloyl-CoA dehydrogenase large subunit [Paracoccaceae bacterium]